MVRSEDELFPFPYVMRAAAHGARISRVRLSTATPIGGPRRVEPPGHGPQLRTDQRLVSAQGGLTQRVVHNPWRSAKPAAPECPVMARWPSRCEGAASAASLGTAVERQSHRADHGFQQAFGLTQRHPECRAQHQAGADGQARVARCLPGVVRYGAVRCSSTSEVIHGVRLPRCFSPSSSSCQFAIPNDISGMWCRRAALCLSGIEFPQNWQARNLPRNPLRFPSVHQRLSRRSVPARRATRETSLRIAARNVTPHVARSDECRGGRQCERWPHFATRELPCEPGPLDTHRRTFALGHHPSPDLPDRMSRDEVRRSVLRSDDSVASKLTSRILSAVPRERRDEPPTCTCHATPSRYLPARNPYRSNESCLY